MKVLIVAKTRTRQAACIGGITFDGRSVRLVAADAHSNEHAGMEYKVGEVWEVDAAPAETLIPPHVENIIVHSKRQWPSMADPVAFIERHMPPKEGGPEALYEGLTRATRTGALYITERIGIPPYSTMFWRPDRSLQRDDDSKRIRYRYPTPDGGSTLTFVGFQEPLESIPAGTLLRVSLTRWWRPDDTPGGEYRCYVQLSGWFPEPVGVVPEEEDGVFAAVVGEVPPEKGQPRAETMQPDMQEAKRLLKSIFGYDTFLPLQAEIIANVLQRRDTLAIMPTGSGKSLCYQLPALLFGGLTVVVSPLIALMEDQVTQLRQLEVPAVFLNSTLAYDAYIATANRIKQGEIKLLYVSPETLLRPETLVMLDQCQVDCLTIDEAHCISSWGHDFRPIYRQLLTVRDRLPHATCLALTATATPRVQADIKETLGFGDANEFIASFNRENLYLTVQPRTDGLAQTLAFLASHRDQSGIIYCSTRRQVDVLAAQLAAHGYSVLPYHAGLDDATRLRHQRLFIRDDVPIMVATIAFGMGINKSNVRFVLHYNLPKNIESYYQEIGRAGRDGLPADCLLLFSHGDVYTIQRLIEAGAPSERPGREVRLQALLRYAGTTRCRRVPLLEYFGERDTADSCGLCDNCVIVKDEGEQKDVTIPAQKFLSCVKRTGEIFGVAHIVSVLRGSRKKSILTRKHDQLSTYGIGMEYPTKVWKHLAQQFIEQGLVRQDMEYGGLSLTPKGYQVFKGEKVYARFDNVPQPTSGGAHLAYDEALFTKLRALRKELADEANLPAYVIFSDRSLVEMATYYPQTPERFLAIHGMGRTKLEKHGDPFLALLRAYCEEHQLPERVKVAPATGGGRDRKRRFEEVGELFAAGHTIEQLQTLFGVKQSTIVDHLFHYARSGYAIEAERVLAASTLTEEEQARVLATIAEVGHEWLMPIYDALAEIFPYEELRIMRLYYFCRLNESGQ